VARWYGEARDRVYADSRPASVRVHGPSSVAASVPLEPLPAPEPHQAAPGDVKERPRWLRRKQREAERPAEELPAEETQASDTDIRKLPAIGRHARRDDGPASQEQAPEPAAIADEGAMDRFNAAHDEADAIATADRAEADTRVLDVPEEQQ
jgi:hypothetical protein